MKKNVSSTRLQRLRAQGYQGYSDDQLSNLAFGIRFPYRLCVAVIFTAIITQSITLFAVMTVIAFLGILLPNHPFDYIYNHIIAGWINQPRVPARSKQLKFACTIATTWLVITVWLLATGANTAGLIMGGILMAMALLPATIDLCIPSVIYNTLFKRKFTNPKANY